MLDIEETVNGMRIDTFLADVPTLSEIDTQRHKTYKEEKEIQKKFIAVLSQNNRLPD